MAFPDLDSPDGQKHPGTLWIPNSAAVVAGGPNFAAAKRLADYLVSAGVEMKMSLSESANVPVRKISWDRFSDGEWIKNAPVVPDDDASAVRRSGAVSKSDPHFARMLDAFKRSAPTSYLDAAAQLRPSGATLKEILLR